VVVLPAPLGPRNPKKLALPDGEGKAFHAASPPIPARQRFEVNDGHGGLIAKKATPLRLPFVSTPCSGI